MREKFECLYQAFFHIIRLVAMIASVICYINQELGWATFYLLWAIYAYLQTRPEKIVGHAVRVQPRPCGEGVDVAELVHADIEARAELGKQKYGERLKTLNGRDSPVDAYQEALDLVMYLRQALWEREHG